MPIPDPAIVTRLRAAGCVFAEDEARLLISAARTPAELAVMVDRRADGLPLEQVLGWAEFCGLRIVVDPGVFVPRRRTEFLVQQAAVLIRGDGADPGGTTPRDPPDLGGKPFPPNPLGPLGPPFGGTARASVPPWPPGHGRAAIIVDLCCGAGAIGAALAASVSGVQVHAVDIDPAAVACARRNLENSGGHVYEGDLFDPLPTALRGRVAIVVANVPYVPTDEMRLLPVEARAHEPRVALDGGPDGLDVLRRVAGGAPGWLVPGGHLLIETSAHQAIPAMAAFTASGLRARMEFSADMNSAVVIGTKPAAGLLDAGEDGP
jgi:release factor glutamine methyltransferase